MNISQPVASFIGGVDFGLLSAEDVKAISVKQIRNPVTFDSLLHPIPGGLYDPALGAFGDNACSTCYLNIYNCPGHPGHIELPVPVYHVSFMPQLLLLLKAKCVYCKHFKLAPTEINCTIGKLRLVEQGLIAEVAQLGNIQLGQKELRKIEVNGNAPHDSGSESEPEEEDEDDLEQRREAFVKKALKDVPSHQGQTLTPKSKVDAVENTRRSIVKDFLEMCNRPDTCTRCNGISPGWRKDKFNKIFRRPLKGKKKAKMARTNLKESSALIEAMKRQRDQNIDEAIDVGDDTSEEASSEGSGEDITMQDENFANGIQAPNGNGSITRAKGKDKDEAVPDEFVNAQEVRASMAELFESEQEILRLIYGNSSTQSGRIVTADMFFITNLLVPPNKYRPEAKMGAGEIAEAPENSQYKNILEAAERLNQIRKEMLGEEEQLLLSWRRGIRELQMTWISLQDAVNTLIDSDRSNATGVAARLQADGVKQKLEKKEGLFRMNMMGKRVNFAARSVISPDPNIETNQVGVPPVFARKLTYPEPVTNNNFYELKQAVLNGVTKWPGAAAIENENGQVVNLRTKNFEERQALANSLLAPSNTNMTGARNKKVHRHLTNGDIVLMNRQPTLHKPSIMAHRARILPGEKTIRMHYANCNTYNADFDGDEMNLHFPQNEIARSEALQIADTDHQYLVATSGKPLRGLIQDHISMGVWLTNRDTFFNREDYYQLLCACLRPENSHTTTAKIETVEPALIKPRPLWTGKQIITTILRNITPLSHPGLTFEGKSQTAGDSWGGESQEGKVYFLEGELLQGILDKAQLGPTGKGFVHSIYEAYGHTVAGKLLSILGRLLTKFLHMRAFTCGIDDLRLTKAGDESRRHVLEQARTIGRRSAATYVTLGEDFSEAELIKRLEDVLRDDSKQAGLDGVCNTRTADLSSEVTAACLPAGLVKKFPYNQMQTMTSSGAKGSNVNANLISCNLGQQILEGRRVPIMVSGKTLPSFRPFETKVRAGGYITDRFLTGIKPQEYFFHAMAGREGLVDTAVKTSRSGYLQRCLIKGMEGLKTEYDSSVRDTDGSMVQFLYGEDGLDVTKQKHLEDFRFLAENFLSVVAELRIATPEFQLLNDRGATEHHKEALKMYRKTGKLDIMDPVLALHNPGAVIGSTSESFAIALKKYCDENPQGLLRDKEKAPQAHLKKRTFTSLLNAKYMKSTIEPGEAIGVVAGQSIGEPSTQMTLNTFHLAGHAAKNVTLGIPRLREIVMTASRSISTPTMTLHLIPELDDNACERFAKGISKLTMAGVIDKVEVSEHVGKGVAYERAKIYNVRLHLFPAADYCETYAIEISDVLAAIESHMVPELTQSIKKVMRKKGDARLLKESDIGKSAKKTVTTEPEAVEEQQEEPADLEGGEDDLDDDGEDDAKNSRKKPNQDESANYDAPDEEEEDIAKSARKDLEEPEDEGIGSSPPTSQDERDSDSEDEDKESTSKQIEARIKDKSSSVTRFAFDSKNAEWCEIQLEYDVMTPKLLLLPLVESACRNAVIQAIPHILDCTFTKEDDPNSGEKKSLPVVLTQGVNLKAMHDYQDILNPHKIFTNDIAAMLKFYGVEACRATIVREMDAVFKGHGIAVDLRHLSLIADVMTRSGGFTPFSRHGMKNSVSPFMKMSFETTTGFVKDAVLEGDWDDLNNPSARIVTGKISKVGTGAFDVLMPVAATAGGVERASSEMN